MTKLIDPLGQRADLSGSLPVDGVTDGYEPFAVASLVAGLAPDRPVIFVLRDGQRLPLVADALRFIDPGLPVLELPAWDCLPYDRVSPGTDAAARRLDALTAMASLRDKPHRAIILVSANALLQRMPPASKIGAQGFHAKPGNQVEMEDLIKQLEGGGFERVATVRDIGQYAVRGGILDLFAPGWDEAMRLDFFGDTLESIRAFDVDTQRTTTQHKEIRLQAMSEVTLSPETISRFRRNYIEAFGAPSRDDELYAAISEGRRFASMEHWLPLFHERLETIFDYLPDAPVIFDHLTQESIAERHDLILDHYDARKRHGGSGSTDAVPYKPVEPAGLYLSPDEVADIVKDRMFLRLTPFAAPDGAGTVIHAGASAGRNFAEERAKPDVNIFEVAVKHIGKLRADGKKVLIAGWSEGSADRLVQILTEHQLGNIARVGSLEELEKLPKGQAGLGILPLEAGFETSALAVVAEQDILGDRLVRRSKKKRKASDFIAEASALAAGDIVVHADHGIGRFVGLKTIEAAGAPHECLELHYAGDDRLFLPVENIELLSRYGSEASDATLDKLGGGAWQSRKAKLKKRLLEMAGHLIRIAAERAMRAAPKILPAPGLYGEFAARFPYEETEDQQNAIDAVIEDLGAGTPMDRL